MLMWSNYFESNYDSKLGKSSSSLFYKEKGFWRRAVYDFSLLIVSYAGLHDCIAWSKRKM
jgi:hypothetical protein